LPPRFVLCFELFYTTPGTRHLPFSDCFQLQIVIITPWFAVSTGAQAGCFWHG